MLLKTAIKYFFFDLALESMFKFQGQNPYGTGDVLFTGRPSVGDRFHRIVFVDEWGKGEYIYFNCTITHVGMFDDYTQSIEFTYHGFEEIENGQRSVREDHKGDSGFILDGTVFLYT